MRHNRTSASIQINDNTNLSPIREILDILQLLLGNILLLSGKSHSRGLHLHLQLALLLAELLEWRSSAPTSNKNLRDSTGPRLEVFWYTERQRARTSPITRVRAHALDAETHPVPNHTCTELALFQPLMQ
jgi:hypothetical protein